ncbi:MULTISPECIES: murein biosynthesis integral membrane protein MurJ [Candidatus Ichthyocystis]|uniref:Probable lipid II flippase MurJ n=1 Tax=Candidatus Ichthyocystis hellenicum TaxID=1561003 RepID=A0A0S4M7S0_9BURK|nr:MULTISPECIES: murein biosynthesis integral membrane protein MurJ [Ichthyocystis]CUT18184.1 conserved membrane protein, MviN domain [Candidatus Ichthyocystis hellenicum]
MSNNRLLSLATVSSMTFASRILGFVRDTCIAHFFGAGTNTDAFVVAFRLPNLLRRIFAEGAFSQAFVPLLSQTNNRSPTETKNFVNGVFTLILITTALVTAIGLSVADPIIRVSAPGFVGKPSFYLSVNLLKITFPYIICISLVTLSAAILNINGKFAISAITPAILNIAMIVAIFVSQQYLKDRITYLAWGVLIGGIIQCLVQIYPLKKINLLPKWNTSFKQPMIKKLITQIGPAILGVSVIQLSLLLNTFFASFLPTGSISWIYYADRLMEFPTGLLGAAMVTVLLPEMSAAHANKDTNLYTNTIDWGLKITLLLAIPASVAIVSIGYDIIVCLFGYGQFGAKSAIETHRALVGYAIGLVPMIAVKVLAPAFYAKQDIKTPAKIAVLVLIITQTGNLLLTGYLQQMGLTLSISLGATFNAILLFHKLKKHGIYAPKPGWSKLITKIIIGSAIMLAFLKAVEPQSEQWFHWSSARRLLTISLICAGGCAVYLASLHMIGINIKKLIKNEH